jgi:hypothetical protein
MPAELFHQKTKGTDMQLKQGNGRVPIRSNNPDMPYIMVPFPNRGEFDALWGKRVSRDSKDRYWSVLNKRAEGATLIESGRRFGISRERARQIEAKFLRLMQRRWQTTHALKTD